jgi:hypothetical protein
VIFDILTAVSKVVFFRNVATCNRSPYSDNEAAGSVLISETAWPLNKGHTLENDLLKYYFLLVKFFTVNSLVSVKGGRNSVQEHGFRRRMYSTLERHKDKHKTRIVPPFSSFKHERQAIGSAVVPAPLISVTARHSHTQDRSRMSSTSKQFDFCSGELTF